MRLFALLGLTGVLLMLLTVAASADGFDDDYDDPPPGFDGEVDCASGPDPGTDEFWAAEGSLWWEECVVTGQVIDDEFPEDGDFTDDEFEADGEVAAPTAVEAGTGGLATGQWVSLVIVMWIGAVMFFRGVKMLRTE
jgi:hypothetical protein